MPGSGAVSLHCYTHNAALRPLVIGYGRRGEREREGEEETGRRNGGNEREGEEERRKGNGGRGGDREKEMENEGEGKEERRKGKGMAMVEAVRGLTMGRISGEKWRGNVKGETEGR